MSEIPTPAEASDPAHTDVNVTVEKKGLDTWKVIERVGIVAVLLYAVGMHMLKQDSSKQDFIQKQAAESALQSKVDRAEERAIAQKTQEQLVEVITSQVVATTEQTVASKEARAAAEKTAEALNEFSDDAKALVDRVDRLVEHVEETK